MKENWSETLWNEEIRRCGVVDIACREGEGSQSKAEMVWTGNLIRRDEGELVRDIIE